MLLGGGANQVLNNAAAATSAGFAVVFPRSAGTLGKMSLNRCEQLIFDYLQRHPDERHYWQGKFQRVSRKLLRMSVLR